MGIFDASIAVKELAKAAQSGDKEQVKKQVEAWKSKYSDKETEKKGTFRF